MKIRTGRRRLTAVVASIALIAAPTAACAGPKVAPAPAAGVNAGPDGKPAPFREPVRLKSKDGVLEVRLSAHQGTVNLDTVPEPVTNFLVFGYDLIKGTASDGSTKGDNLYPAPTLRVDPGEKLVVHYDNDLAGLTIKDFYDPAFTPKGGEVPIYPPTLTEAPLNLHTHGLHVSPSGNADNVLLSIPAGMGNTYTYDVPKNMPNGLYWYHSHRHTMTTQQTYLGLAGLLEIGRPDGNLPLVTQHNIPVRDMAFQYNYVFDRKGKGHQLNNYSWPQFVSTLTPPQGNQLADGTYRPSLAPVNIADTSMGAQYLTPWWAGPLSPHNNRGQTQFIPQNLMSFDSPTVKIPENDRLPENERDVQFTVNGQFQPELKIKPGQTEIWAVANISDIGYMTVRLTETATGNHPKFTIVGQDGNPYTQVQRPVYGDGTTLSVPPGSRYAIAVTMPKEGDLVLEFPPNPEAKPLVLPGVVYTNNGTEHTPAVLGTLTVDPKYMSFADGFFVFPTQTLIRATPDTSGPGQTTVFAPGQNLDAYTSFVDTSVMTPAVNRAMTITDTIGGDKASNNDPKAVIYMFEPAGFPNVPLIQPRLNSVEEWKITNFNNDAHPMHIHVNDFQVMAIDDPNRGKTGVQPWGLDNVNVPAPVFNDMHVVSTPATLTLRQEFLEFVGTYVIHCHRLNHEDNGLMATINVIPEVSSYAVAVPGGHGRPASIQVRDGGENGAGDRVLQTVYPFPDFEGTPSVAMADVNGDGILDLVAGTGKGVAPEVVAYDGNNTRDGLFKTELARFAPFDADFTGGVSVAATDIDGNALADNIIVGSGPGMESQIKVFSSTLPDIGKAPEVFSAFTPYPGSQSGVTLATGMVESGSGRESVVTAPGPGEPPLIKSFRWDLYTPTARAQANGTATPQHAGKPSDPKMTAQFLAYDETYQDGVALSTGWVAGAEGGSKSIITSQLGGAGTVVVWSSGSLLDGQPAIYLDNPNHHEGDVTYQQISSFAPFPAGGATVATSSTVYGADLLVAGGNGEVRKYGLARSAPDAKSLTPKLITSLPPIAGAAGVVPLGGR
ncbi:multicopper oxidase domain-containing protein [Mycolicibacterium fluoranthenivorans]|uniref:FtsP/CotA-like multicopper oxidase with cupredoxin domain n=1 Tax=Mycolicibacterium fluoranthenivorans TaxID=258505 RepID=A0A7X5TWC1_9MYCO|nr:multicopper oxidase domain-containing protein [Mycolicibacterium fluoranthenivorans]MCV7355254.1 multicopper oxidase domain-containing protein [Mycolicibacterium fluoranthenivorans]NIH93948.1 FtsP/CotA-like multicopper oxidase with cupredoxin domain [Mycolicibacterium fluoranthenivorans]